MKSTSPTTFSHPRNNTRRAQLYAKFDIRRCSSLSITSAIDAANECRYYKAKLCHRRVHNQPITDGSISTMKHINFSCCQQPCQNWLPKRLIESSQFQEKLISKNGSTFVLNLKRFEMWCQCIICQRVLCEKKRTRISIVAKKKKRKRIPAMARWEKKSIFFCVCRDLIKFTTRIFIWIWCNFVLVN